jgi:site-specific recombinase XerD
MFRLLMSLAGHRLIGTTQVYVDLNDNIKRRVMALV